MADMKKLTVSSPVQQPEPSVKDSLLASLENDPVIQAELKRLGIAKEEMSFYLPTLLEFQENHAACAACHGLDECKSSSESYQMVLEISDSGKLAYHWVECPFAQEKHRLTENYLFRDFSDEWLSATAQSMRDLKSRKIRQVALLALKNKIGKNWAYFYGEEGTGKSYALAALCNDIAKAGKHIAFLNCNQEFDELKNLAIKDRPNFEETMERILSSDLLVLDGFGDEFKSDYVRDQIVMPLLNERSKRGTPLFFSSNYSLNEIQSLYQTSKASYVIAKRMTNLIRNKLAIQESLNPEGEFKVEKGLENLIPHRKG